MSQGGNYLTNGGGGGGSILSETGNSGGAVGPSGGGNLNVLGSQGFNVVGNAGTNTLTLSNLRNAAKYVVSATSGQGGYTTIQSAVNQAVTDGASGAFPATIWIFPGTYTEDINVPGNINLASAGGVFITGQAYIHGSGICMLTNLFFVSNSGGFTLLIDIGTVVYLFNCALDGVAGTALGIGVSCTVYMFGGRIVCNSVGKLIAIGSSDVTISGVITTGGETFPSTITDLGNLSVIGCYCADAFVLTGISTCKVLNSFISSGDFACFSTDIGGDAYVLATNSTLNSNVANAYFVTGGGVFQYADISAFGFANQIDPFTTQGTGSYSYLDNITFDGGITTMKNDGYVIMGSTSLGPGLGTLTAGQGIGVTNASRAITIDAIGTVTTVTGASQTITNGVTYIANRGTSIAFLLPVTASVGHFIKIIGKGAGAYTIAQNASQTVHQGASNTTTGVVGVTTATQRYTSMHLVCITADTDWVIVDSSGTLTLA